MPMTYEEFAAKLDNLTPDGRFSFGFNWLDYVRRRINDDMIASHLADLQGVYSQIANRGSLIDIGSGSGLSSLCFRKLGFAKVHSIDLDPHSVTAAKELMDRHAAAVTGSEWLVEQQSILDPAFIKAHKSRFDVVYSWGVLHHTGHMWQAIRHAAALVKPEGHLHLALYIGGDRLFDHLKMKFQYHFLDTEGKKRLLYSYLDQLFFQRGIDVFRSKDARGMNEFNDAMDWLGGLPYETCDPDVLDSYLWSMGLRKTHYQHAQQGGNFVAVYRRV